MMKPPTTFRETLVRTAVPKMVALAALAAGIAVTGTVAALTAEQSDDTPTPAPSKAEVLIDRHDCWSGPAPADMEGELPGHVVVTTSAGETVYAGSRRVGQALEQVFEGADHGLTVHAFCR